MEEPVPCVCGTRKIICGKYTNGGTGVCGKKRREEQCVVVDVQLARGQGEWSSEKYGKEVLTSIDPAGILDPPLIE